MGVHGDHAHDLLTHSCGEFTLHHSNEIIKKLNLKLVASGHRITFKGGFHSLHPVDEVDQKGDLCGVILKPVSLLFLSEAFERVGSNVFNRTSHRVNDILEIVLDFSFEFKFVREGDVLLADRRVNTAGIRAFTARVLKFKLINGLEDLRHVDHNLLGGRTIR